MKLMIAFLFGLLIPACGFSQFDGFQIEKTQLAGNYVLVKIVGPIENYVTYVCKGTVDEVNATVLLDGDLQIDQNNRDNFEENIDLGLLPSDIYYFDGNNENMIVYGGHKLLIFDGDTHENIIADFELNTKVSQHNMAFMPVSPYHNQIVSNRIDDNGETKHFIMCADEGGGLTVIQSKPDNEFEWFYKFYDNYDQSLLLSSSVYAYCNTSFYWILNYWDGTCKVKRYIWDQVIHHYNLENEKEFGESKGNEIIDFKTKETPGPLRLALLNRVIDIEPTTLEEITSYEVIVDKLKLDYGHIKDEPSLFIFNEGNGTGTTFTNENMITMATSAGYDWDNERVYFTGYCDNTEPEFKVINYNPSDPENPFLHYSLDGAMDVNFNPAHDLAPFFTTVFAVGNKQIIGFDDGGIQICTNNLDCHYGYRIASDNNGNGINERIGTTVACLIDGLLVQRKEYQCDQIAMVNIVKTGISTSLTCFDEKNATAYFFYNGDGGSDYYATYDETNDQKTYHKIGGEDKDLSETTIDCIYNKESNLVLASLYSQCDNYFRFLEISDGNLFVSEEVYDNIGRFINYENYIFCYVESTAQEHYIYRISQNNGIVIKEYIGVEYEINALEVNGEDDRIYCTLVYSSPTGEGLVVETDKDLSFTQYHSIGGTNPVDISYLSGLNKIYIAQDDQSNNGWIEIYDTDFVPQFEIEINGYPTSMEYNPFQRQAYILSDDPNEEGFTNITVIDCIEDQILEEKSIRRSDGYVYDTINDQFYFHTNYPDVNEVGELEYNIKALNGFNNNFSNQVNTDLYTYSDIFLSKDRTVLSKPSYNYTDNIIYAGNYGACSVSKIKAYDESLTFRPGVWEWLSFPRLERYKDEIFPTIPLLERLAPWPPSYIEMIYEPGGIDPKNIVFNGFQWVQNTLIDVKSTQGYKLQYEGNTSLITLRLEGAKEDYDTEVDLLVEGENWLGYFLDENYMPQQCLPSDIWDDLVQIQTQHWSMTKTSNDPPWVYIGKPKPFEYGDLVVLILDKEYTNFQWQMPGEGEEVADFPETAYYSYEEQPDYLPFYIETDSTSNIQEIAVLADGVVKGAAVREPGDTLVEVKGYLEEVPAGAAIEFETWNGYKSEPVEKHSYVVIDHQHKVREQRTIYTGEKAMFHHVSLKANEVYELPPAIGTVTCKPNPFRQSVEFSFRLNREANVHIEVLDINGIVIKTVINGFYPEGLYNFTWQGENEAGHRIVPGVYFYKVSAGNELVQSDKLVMIK